MFALHTKLVTTRKVEVEIPTDNYRFDISAMTYEQAMHAVEALSGNRKTEAIGAELARAVRMVRSDIEAREKVNHNG